MEQVRVRPLTGLAVFVAILWLLPTVGGAETKERTCKPGNPAHTIEHFLKELKPGDTLLVSGTCNENVEIPAEVHRITLDGQGSATINGPDATSPTVEVKGNDIVIKSFTITGGLFGLRVIAGGTAIIDGNIIQNTGRDGISVSQNSSAQISNNTIQNNPEDGIAVSESSSGRIGFREVRDLRIAGPNIIQNNGDRGIAVTRSSSARIFGNTIKNNVGNGVDVVRASHADISSNTINNNGGDGIFVSQNSGVNLGRDTTQDPLSDDPNITTVNNVGRGIRCRINSYADGRLGTLNGNDGQTSFDANCINATTT